MAKSNQGKKAGRKEGSKQISINSEKLSRFCQLYSMNTPRTEVEKELRIGKAQYYKYIDAAEEIVDDFLLGMVDHGLVLQFRTTLQRVSRRADKLDELASKALEDYPTMDESEKNTANRLIANANQTDKLYTEMLDDVKLVNETVKTLNKVIVKSNTKSTEEGKSNGT